ncbi:glycosyl hydrolase 53 family protein [Bernardetia sp.]|uniref:glycosyl hydrolase 53 family protein n=1 Tax=Bernardetia sp. TaxID=1937974 RepID=UPI0025B88CE0|nr:glycosyl hydrolase 53 family protein [Bernardetia sp.]
MKTYIALFFSLLFLVSCSKEDTEAEKQNYKMGFTTFPYEFSIESVNDTYNFIEQNADIYSEHIDNTIPWDALINQTELPTAFTDEINSKVNRKINSHPLLLSVSILNTLRTDLENDFDGQVPTYTSLSDEHIENGYFRYLEYLIDRLSPNYLVMAMEVNELKKNNPTKWEEYKQLGDNIRSRLKTKYPSLKIAESFTLHNWYEKPTDFVNEIREYSSKSDFLAISFYPFIMNKHTEEEFQAAFDFLHSQTSKPIAFVETNTIAQNLSIPNLDVFIPSSQAEQKVYLETLLKNAQKQKYEFVIWWAHRDYDRLLPFFPEEAKDIGLIWRDTGLLDEDGNQRLAFSVWKENFDR